MLDDLLMTKRGVVYDREYLKQRSVDVEPGEIDEIKAKLHAALYNQVNCLGLAAIQIGILKRVGIFRDNRGNVNYLINPVIIARCKEKWLMRESCMSMRGARFIFERPLEVTITNNGKVEMYDGRDGRVVQHEIDHMAGITVYDRYMEYKKNPKNRRNGR